MKQRLKNFRKTDQSQIVISRGDTFQAELYLKPKFIFFPQELWLVSYQFSKYAELAFLSCELYLG